MQGSKYGKRWFELTAERLAYAKDPGELKLRSKNVEVFDLEDMQYVKRAKVKLEVRDPAEGRVRYGCVGSVLKRLSMHLHALHLSRGEQVRDMFHAAHSAVYFACTLYTPCCCHACHCLAPALQLRFPSRVLRLKADTAEDAERWEDALKKANMMKVHGGGINMLQPKSPIVSTARVSLACAWRQGAVTEEVGSRHTCSDSRELAVPGAGWAHEVGWSAVHQWTAAAGIRGPLRQASGVRCVRHQGSAALGIRGQLR